jgi:hypothetical protein
MVSTVTAILDLLGVDYVATGGPGFCCGIVHHRGGDEEAARGMAGTALRHLEAFEPELVLMWCPSCIYYYDEIIGAELPFPSQHVAEYLAGRLDDLEFVREVPARVGLHWHSFRPSRRREAVAAKAMLSAVPGLEQVDLSSDDALGNTCTPAEALRPDWERAVERQLQEAADADLDTLATLYHGCQRLLCVREEHSPFAVEHYLSVFGRALGIEHEDVYKRYQLWHDPDRILADMAPCMVANDVELELARDVVERTFARSGAQTERLDAS